MEMMHKTNNSTREFVDLTMQLADDPGDELIMKKIEKNRRLAELQEDANRNSKVLAEWKLIKNRTQRNLESPYVWDNDRQELREYKKLLAEKCSGAHVEARRGLKIKKEDYGTKLKALSGKRDKDSLELKKTIGEIFEKCKNLASRYDKFFQSSKRGRALLAAGCI